MKFVDEARIEVAGGKGGNGVASFPAMYTRSLTVTLIR